MKKAIANICRFLLAVTFLFSGFVKANDPMGMAYKIADYFTAFGIPSPEWLNIVLAVLLACFEVGLSACLYLNRKAMSILMVMVMTVLTAFTVYIYIENPVSDCGCFGDAIILTNGETLAKNCVLLAAAIVMLIFHKHLFKYVSRKWGWLLPLTELVLAMIYSAYCLIYQPVIDFRPYKVGYNMNERVELEEAEVEGVKVARYDAAGFTLLDENGDDVTYEPFETEGTVYLITVPNLNEANCGCVGEIDELYDYAMMKGEQFYFITASDEEAIQEWKDKTAAEYPFYVGDERVLKTVVRANPGLVVIKDGVIVSKSGTVTLGNDINKLIHKN